MSYGYEKTLERRAVVQAQSPRAHGRVVAKYGWHGASRYAVDTEHRLDIGPAEPRDHQKEPAA